MTSSSGWTIGGTDGLRAKDFRLSSKSRAACSFLIALASFTCLISPILCVDEDRLCCARSNVGEESSFLVLLFSRLLRLVDRSRCLRSGDSLRTALVPLSLNLLVLR